MRQQSAYFWAKESKCHLPERRNSPRHKRCAGLGLNPQPLSTRKLSEKLDMNDTYMVFSYDLKLTRALIAKTAEGELQSDLQD